MVNLCSLLPIVQSIFYHYCSYSIRYPLGKGVDSENIIGVTLVDFIALPPRARLSISYSGDSAAEGFLGLRKL